MSDKPIQFDEGVKLADPEQPDISNPVPDWAEVKPEDLDDNPTAPQDRLKATRYHDDFHYRRVEQDGWFPLATMRVPRGLIGIIYQIQTLAITFQGTNTIYWYSQFDPLLVQKFGVLPIRWKLQVLTRTAVELPPNIQPFAAPPVPDHPHLGTWEDGRFAWPAINNRLRLQIHEGTIARLWCGVPTALPAIERPDVIGGRIIGLSQSYNNNPAARYASEKGW